ncbi:MAG: MMPL family transporter [Myxococcales bacterium]|nr:MMPL family transporter [Myxococcota bacterium]MDW8283806.1 MMPL family transporter [Myxococcales bacterium]
MKWLDAWLPARGIAAGLQAYAALSSRRPWLLLLPWGLVAVASIGPIAGLELRTDMAELLPPEHPAVVALRKVTSRQISATSLVVLVHSPDREANRSFSTALRSELAGLVPHLFSAIEHRPDPEVADYVARTFWLYADLADLEHAEVLLDRLAARRSAPLFVDLEGDVEEELRRLRDKVRAELPVQAPPYFEAVDPDGSHHLGLLLWRRAGGLAAAGDAEALAAVQERVARVGPKRFHPQMRVEYTGPLAMALREQQALRADLTLATVLCGGLVLGAIYLFFRRAALLLGVGAPAVLGVLLSLVVARLTLPALNANTAFLIAIILGNGINSPIVLLARYGEERRAGRPLEAAVCIAMVATLRGTLTAMAAASVAYGALLLTHLPGLSQFGLIGGVGMLLVWLLTFLVVPPLVCAGERLWPGAFTPPPRSRPGRLASLGRFVGRRPVALVGLGLLLAAGPPALQLARDPLEYDLSRLRAHDPEAQRLWGTMYRLGLGHAGAGAVGTDGALLVDAPEQAVPVARAMWQQDQARGAQGVLRAVRTLTDLLPAQQQQKLALLSRLRDRIDRLAGRLTEEERAELRRWRPPEDLRPLTAADLPRALRDRFTEADGTVGRLIGIDADPARFSDEDGRALLRLAQALRVEALGRTWVAAAPSTIFAGLIETILRDGPRVGAAALGGVVLLLGASFGLRGLVPVGGALVVGLLWLCGLMGAFGLRLNFVNFVAVPITIGIGADYAANLWARIRLEGPDRIGHALGATGPAVVLCSLTTIIGYGSLLLARNRALQSFGLLAVLGEATCLLSALMILPVLARCPWLWRAPPPR